MCGDLPRQAHGARPTRLNEVRSVALLRGGRLGWLAIQAGDAMKRAQVEPVIGDGGGRIAGVADGILGEQLVGGASFDDDNF